jgi:RHS repeat-associated protein
MSVRRDCVRNRLNCAINKGSRFYNADIGRFLQPDTIVPEPGNPQALNRYSYVNNNPIRYNDPSG